MFKGEKFRNKKISTKPSIKENNVWPLNFIEDNHAIGFWTLQNLKLNEIHTFGQLQMCSVNIWMKDIKIENTIWTKLVITIQMQKRIQDRFELVKWSKNYIEELTWKLTTFTAIHRSFT
jgi:hypothetical protein